MKVQIIINEINTEFDKDYAEEYYSGRESNNNKKFIFKDSYKLDDVISYRKIDGVNRKFNIEIDHTKKEVNINDFFMIEFESNQKFSFGVFNKLIARKHFPINHKYSFHRFYFYLKSEFNLINIGHEYLVIPKLESNMI